jgi:hypothetical protein
MRVKSKYRGKAFDGPKTLRPRCGAGTSSGRPCQAQGLRPSGRCFRHGGMSTGPRTLGGKARQRAAARETMRRIWQERREGRRSMPVISEEKRAEMALRARQRQGELRAARDARQHERRWKERLKAIRHRQHEASLARKEAARIRHAEAMRRYRAKKRIQRENSIA